MTQNFRRRITLLPNSFCDIQNSMKKFKEIDLIEKADNDTFNKSIVNKITPMKKKKLNSSLLDTPIIEEKKERRISIYSPLSFKEDSSLKYTPISTQENDDYNKIDKSSELIITNFSPTFSEEIEEFFPNFNYNFLCKKLKKLIRSNKKSENEIIFIDGNNHQYQFELFDDQDVFGEDKNYKDKEKRISNLKFQDDENSDDEKIQNDYEICIKKLEEAIDYYSKNPNCISRK